MIEELYRIMCRLVNHRFLVVNTTILDGRDYVEVDMVCRRCSAPESEILEYNE